MSKVVWNGDADECWTWGACKTHYGYGLFGIGGKNRLVHRIAYELFVGPIPEGLQLDHLCRNRACVNPEHLEPVTARENTLRSTSFAALNAAKDSCLRGHPLRGENLYISSRGKRVCRECKRANNRRYWREKHGPPSPIPASAKLTPDEVAEIRAEMSSAERSGGRRSPGTVTRIAAKFGVSTAQIHRIAQGVSWHAA